MLYLIIGDLYLEFKKSSCIPLYSGIEGNASKSYHWAMFEDLIERSRGFAGYLLSNLFSNIVSLFKGFGQPPTWLIFSRKSRVSSALCL